MGEFRLAIASELVRGEDKFASEFAVTQIKKLKRINFIWLSSSLFAKFIDKKTKLKMTILMKNTLSWQTPIW